MNPIPTRLEMPSCVATPNKIDCVSGGLVIVSAATTTTNSSTSLDSPSNLIFPRGSDVSIVAIRSFWPESWISLAGRYAPKNPSSPHTASVGASSADWLRSIATSIPICSLRYVSVRESSSNTCLLISSCGLHAAFQLSRDQTLWAEPPKCQQVIGTWRGKRLIGAWDIFLDSQALSAKTNSTGPIHEAL
jgi:hypothetical protein